MRLSLLNLLCIASFSSLCCGCGGDATQPEGPELGSVQAYLDEHPEALIDEEVPTEDEEMAASDE